MSQFLSEEELRDYIEDSRVNLSDESSLISSKQEEDKTPNAENNDTKDCSDEAAILAKTALLKVKKVKLKHEAEKNKMSLKNLLLASII